MASATASSALQGSYFQGHPDAPPLAALGAALAFHGMPPSAPHLRRDLVLWMVALRRITVLAGLSVAILEKLLLPDELALAPVLVVALAVCIYNEVGGRLLRVDQPGRIAAVVNAQVALDTLSLVALLHFGGGLTSLGVLFFAPAFFAYGAVLPLPLASARADLLARNEREAARVRVLLDVAQHVSAMHTVEALLRAVCDTTVALVRVPRVEIFLWDAERQGLCLAAAHGLDVEPGGAAEVRYTADLPIIGRLRAGEVVQFGAGPSHALVSGRVALSFSRGFAAPLVCRGSFEGALFVGYGEEDAGGLIELVQGIARQAALALVNVRTMEQQQQDAEVSRVLLSLSQGLSSCLDEDALWQLLVRGASEVLELPWSIAARFDEHSGTFSIAGGSGVPQADLDAIGNGRFRLEDFPRLQEAITRRELLIGDGATVRPLWLPRGWRSGAWIAIPLFRSGWVAGFVAAGRLQDRRPFDRRHLRLSEGLGHHASIALQNARLVADLEAADRLKSEFVSTMSHELRTPLNVISGSTEMLREGAVGPITGGQRELIDRLDARGRELLELIEATLHVGRLEAG